MGSSLVFKNPNAGDLLVKSLAAIIEEWDPENVVVVFPLAWKHNASKHNLGRVRIEYAPKNSVSIQVRRRDDSIILERTEELEDLES